MAASYTDAPNNWSELEPYIKQCGFNRDILVKKKCFFYDACSFRYHANMKPESAAPILEYIKAQDGIIVITRCILMELASHSGTLNQTYIRYCKKITQSGLNLYVIYEEDLFSVMETCFGTNASINRLLVWSVRMIKGPVSTITKALKENGALNELVIKGRNLDNSGIYKQFFSAVRANKESGDNLGEELLGICLHILSHLPGEADGKFCIITDDKGAAGKIDNLFKKTNRQFQGKQIIIFSTPKLAQILYKEAYIAEKDTLVKILNYSQNTTIKVLGIRIYDLKSNEITLSCNEAAEEIAEGRIHIVF